MCFHVGCANNMWHAHVFPTTGAMRLPKPAASASAQVNIDNVTVDETLPYGKDCDGTLPMDLTSGISVSVASLLQKEDESATIQAPDDVQEPVEVLCS